MADIIKHRGIVENIDGSHIQVRIVQTSACSACSVKGHCNASESKDKLIDVYENHSAEYYIGQNVMVHGTTSMGMQAVLLAFGVPFLVLFIALYKASYKSSGFVGINPKAFEILVAVKYKVPSAFIDTVGSPFNPLLESILIPPKAVVEAFTKVIVLASEPLYSLTLPIVNPAPTVNALATLLAVPTCRASTSFQIG